MMMMEYMYAPQKWPPHQAKCLRRKAMMMISIEITNATKSSKVDFSDGVPGSRVLQRSNLGPGVVGWVVLEHLQTSKTSHHQSKNSTQYLIAGVSLIIGATGDDHLLVQVSSSQTSHRPGKNLLCTEQHFWKVHMSKCICTGIVILMVSTIITNLKSGGWLGPDFYLASLFWRSGSVTHATML